MTLRALIAEAAVPENDASAVAGLVLTHRRPRLATQVVRQLVDVEGLDPQSVTVVVNGEGGLDDPTLEAAVDLLRLPENLGAWGGWQEGLIHIRARGAARWVYLCEDDVGLLELPSPRLADLVRRVQALEKTSPGPVGAVVAFARDLDLRTGIARLHFPGPGTGPFEDVDVSGFGAPWLLSTLVLHDGILPDGEWFFGYGDFDFFLRLRSAGYRLVLDTSVAAGVARQVSDAGRQEAFVATRPGDDEEPWRDYYRARNFLALSRRHGNPGWTAWHLVKSLRRMQRASGWPARRAIAHGLADGFRGRTGRNPAWVRQQGEL